MKRTFILLITAIFCSTASAQFKARDRVINLGVGLGARGFSGTLGIPPVSFSYEMGMGDGIGPGIIGAGAYLGLATSTYRVTNTGTPYGWNYTYGIIGGRGYYHLEIMDDFDTYAGVMFGYKLVMHTQFGSLPNNANVDSPQIIWAFFAGGRYYFTKNLGLMAEIGYGISYVNVGLAYKL